LFYNALALLTSPFFTIGSTGNDNALLEIESQLEARINTVFLTMLEETEKGENEKASIKTENEENLGKSKSSKGEKEKTNKIDPGFVTSLNNYHKAI